MPYVDLTIKSDHVLGSTEEFLKAFTVEHEELNDLAEQWEDEGHGVYPYGALEFLRWLEQQVDEDGKPFLIEAPHWDSTIQTANTVNDESWLDEDFHYTLFKYEGANCVAISDAVSVRNPHFYELTCDSMEDFFAWRGAVLVCGRPLDQGGPHILKTEDMASWFRFEVMEGTTFGQRLALREMQQGGSLHCPVCGILLTTSSSGV